MIVDNYRTMIRPTGTSLSVDFFAAQDAPIGITGFDLIPNVGMQASTFFDHSSLFPTDISATSVSSTWLSSLQATNTILETHPHMSWKHKIYLELTHDDDSMSFYERDVGSSAVSSFVFAKFFQQRIELSGLLSAMNPDDDQIHISNLDIEEAQGDTHRLEVTVKYKDTQNNSGSFSLSFEWNPIDDRNEVLSNTCSLINLSNLKAKSPGLGQEIYQNTLSFLAASQLFDELPIQAIKVGRYTWRHFHHPLIESSRDEVITLAQAITYDFKIETPSDIADRITTPADLEKFELDPPIETDEMSEYLSELSALGFFKGFVFTSSQIDYFCKHPLVLALLLVDSYEMVWKNPGGGTSLV